MRAGDTFRFSCPFSGPARWPPCWAGFWGPTRYRALLKSAQAHHTGFFGFGISVISGSIAYRLRTINGASIPWRGGRSGAAPLVDSPWFGLDEPVIPRFCVRRFPGRVDLGSGFMGYLVSHSGCFADSGYVILPRKGNALPPDFGKKSSRSLPLSVVGDGSLCIGIVPLFFGPLQAVILAALREPWGLEVQAWAWSFCGWACSVQFCGDAFWGGYVGWAKPLYRKDMLPLAEDDGAPSCAMVKN